MISSPPADSTTPSLRPGVGRTLRAARRVSQFASVQMLVQLIGFATGIFLVRQMRQTEYALFTIANTMQGTLNILADVGISIGMISIGGRVWQDSHRFGELISTGLHLRRRLGLISILGVTPILYFMLSRNGASLFYTIILVGAVLAGLFAQLSVGVLEVIPRLRADVRQIQVIDFSTSTARLVVLLSLGFVFLNAGVAVSAGAGALLFQYLLLRHYAANVIDLQAKENPEDRKAIMSLIRKQAPNAIFFCLQGQITIFLISFFARRPGAIAEVGALGRLGMIFTVLGSLMANIFAPAFARSREPRRLIWLYLAIVGAVSSLSLVIFAAAAFLPNEFLFVLGPKYSHLQHELLLMVGGAVLFLIASTMWSLNAARAWIGGSWLCIPMTIATQLALIPFTDFSSVSGVLTFNLICVAPSLLLNIGLSWFGFRSLKEQNAIA
jgi:hypothetical protein